MAIYIHDNSERLRVEVRHGFAGNTLGELRAILDTAGSTRAGRPVVIEIRSAWPGSAEATSLRAHLCTMNIEVRVLATPRTGIGAWVRKMVFSILPTNTARLLGKCCQS